MRYRRYLTDNRHAIQPAFSSFWHMHTLHESRLELEFQQTLVGRGTPRE